MKKIIYLFSFLNFALSFAQTNPKEHLSGFNMLSFTYKHDKHWFGYVELQERSIENFSKIDYYEAKGGAGYTFNKNNQTFIGIGKYGTYKNSKIATQEFRIWLQYTFSQNISKLKIDQRLRLEKRFFHYPQSDNNANDERLRYRLALTLPLGKDKIGPNTFFANAYDEIFFAPKEPNFKRNRVYGGFGYQFNDYVNTNLGCLWQREFTLSGNRNLYFLYFGINFNFDRLKYNESQHIPVAD